MKILNNALLLLMCAGLATSCGGGGGSASSNTTAIVNSSAGSLVSVVSSSTGSLSSVSSSASFSTSTKISINFPSQNALVTSNKVTVRGHAFNPNGIKSVKVNGIPAAISGISNSAFSMEVYKPAPAKLNTGDVISAVASNTTLVTEVDWQATVDVPFGSMQIEVMVEDSLGNSETDKAGSINLRNLRVPTIILKDLSHNRWLGIGDAFSDSIAIDIPSKKITELPALSHALKTRPLDTHSPESLALDSTGNSFYASSILKPSILGFYKTDIYSADVQTLLEHDFNFDASNNSFANVSSSTMDSANNIYYVLVNTFGINSHNKSQVFAFNIRKNEVNVVYDSSSDAAFHTGITDIAYFNGSLFLLKSGTCCTEDVYKLSLQTNAFTKVANLVNLASTHIAIDELSNIIYVVGLFNIAKIELQNNAVSYISSGATTNEVYFPQPVRSVVDENGNLIVSDSDLTDLFSVDTDTGERATFVESGIGSGGKMQAPAYVVVSPSMRAAYVLDMGFNMKPAFLKVDLATGNRKKLLEVDSEISLGNTFSSLVLDESHNRLYASVGRKIVVMDLVSEKFTILSDFDNPDGVSLNAIKGMIYDNDLKKLIITSGDNQVLYGLDPNSGVLSVVKNLTTTEGENITGVSKIIKNAIDGSILALNKDEGKLYSLNIGSGHKSLILDTCYDAYGRNVMSPGYDSIFNMEIDGDKNLLYLYGIYFYTFDLNTKSCKITPDRYNPRDGKMLKNNTLLIVTNHEVGQLDLKTHEIVVISR